MRPCAVCGSLCSSTATTCAKCRPNSGADNGRWKGGRIVDKRSGYVMVWAPDHPSTVRSYVAEHRLVMEQTIGRLLLPGETVHHRNGVRDDNRAENLELWAGSQPSGQRACDLLAWARSIIVTYEPIEEMISC